MMRPIFGCLVFGLCLFTLLGGCGNPPAPPQNVRAELTGGLKRTRDARGITSVEIVAQDVQVSWSPVEDAERYTVYWSAHPKVTGETCTGRSTTVGTSYTCTVLEEGKTYFFIVTAWRDNRESECSQEARATPGRGHLDFDFSTGRLRG